MNFKIMTSIQNIFADYNRMKVEINNKKTRKFTIMWKLSNTLLNTNGSKKK